MLYLWTRRNQSTCRQGDQDKLNVGDQSDGDEDISESACWCLQLLETVQTTLNIVLSTPQSDRSHGPIIQVQHQ